MMLSPRQIPHCECPIRRIPSSSNQWQPGLVPLSPRLQWRFTCPLRLCYSSSPIGTLRTDSRCGFCRETETIRKATSFPLAHHKLGFRAMLASCDDRRGVQGEAERASWVTHGPGKEEVMSCSRQLCMKDADRCTGRRATSAISTWGAK